MTPLPTSHRTSFGCEQCLWSLTLNAVGLQQDPSYLNSPGSESQSLSPHGCDSVLLDPPSCGWDNDPSWALASPTRWALSGWCAQGPGHRLSEIMWPLKGALGELNWQQAPLSLPFSTVFEVEPVSDFWGWQQIGISNCTKVKVSETAGSRWVVYF